MESSRGIFHTEGDTNDILFEQVSVSRQLREGDIVTFIDGGQTVVYKIETVDYRVEKGHITNQANAVRDYWKTPVTYFGMSVVP